MSKTIDQIIDDLIWDEQRILWNDTAPNELRKWDCRNLIANDNVVGF